MADVLKGVSTRRTPTSQPAGGATTKNAAGGFVFAIDDVTRLRRFLTLGTEGGTYYTKAPELTRQNADVVIRMAKNDPTTLVDTIVEISVAGRAPRQNQAIFALAIAASEADAAGRAYALSKLNAVCRTGTHLYLFVGYVQQFRGWGRQMKRMVGKWYTDRAVDKLAYQLLKYRQREGWMHRDVLRLARPNPGSPEREQLLRYLMVKAKGDQEPTSRAIEAFGEKAKSPWAGHSIEPDMVPPLVTAYEQAQGASVKGVIELIANHDLSWEMLPDAMLGEPKVWEALIHKGMPITALTRQLPRLTRLGLLKGSVGARVASQLADPALLKRGRVHPISMLVAARTYGQGHNARGPIGDPDRQWTPVPKIVDALDAGFYAAYGAVEPSGKRILLACDVSGSMSSPAGGLPITCREAVGAISLVTLNTESNTDIIGFSDGRVTGGYMWGGAQSVCCRLDITPRRRLDDVCKYMSGLNFGRTDCALPMVWAAHEKENFDQIVILTDNETWYNRAGMHPWQALAEYRNMFGETRFTVVAMTATGTSICDPDDPHSLDIAGFDANTPQVISHFAAGRI